MRAGRFLQPDPKEFGAGDYNFYRYCHNDPVNKTDPTGYSEAWPWTNWDYLPPVAYVHAWFDAGFNTSQGLISLNDAMDAAGKAGQERTAELVGIGEGGPVPGTLGGDAVNDAIPEIANDIQTAISGIPGTSFTGPPSAPTSANETVGTAVAGTIIGLGTRAAEMDPKDHLEKDKR